MPKKKKKQQIELAAPKKSKKPILLLALLILWSIICVAVYYLSIVKHLDFLISVYMVISLLTLTPAILINAYANARLTSENPDEKLVNKIRNTVKILIIIGLPPISCVLIEYIAGWILNKFS